MNKAELNNNKGSILIVDDNTESLDLLSASLREQGYKVRPATSGELALKSAFNDPPDLILLDIIMPGMNGYDVCSQLKKNILTKNIPVIFLTSKEMEYDEEKGFTHGAVDYITRPFNPALLKSRINTHIELKKHRERLEELVKQKIKEIRIKNQKLQTNLNLIQTLIDTMPNPVYYKDTEGKYLGCNTSFSEKILGIPLYEFTEKKIY